MRIAVIGHSGSGKSTLAQTLAQREGLPLLHLDQLNFLPGWVQRDRAEALALADAFQDRPGWVIDGNYPSLGMERRMELADLILFLDFPPLLCLRRAVGRYRKHRGRVRDSAAEGCREKLDWAFVRWILWEGRSGAYRQRYRRIEAAYPGKILVLKTPRAVRDFLARSLT